jgi:hypothetical protein
MDFPLQNFKFQFSLIKKDENSIEKLHYMDNFKKLHSKNLHSFIKAARANILDSLRYEL